MKKVIFPIAFGLIILLGSCSNSDWQQLFNGKDFEGFIQLNGKAQYLIENGEMVGISTAGTPNSFMCTEKEYSDFILEFEVKVDSLLNSGVQIRSHSIDSINKGRVFGYQVEIDPSSRGWSGGIYDEARRAWLYPVTPYNNDAVKALNAGVFDKVFTRKSNVDVVGMPIYSDYEVKELLTQIANKPVQMVDVDKMNNLIETVYKGGMKVKTTHKNRF